MNPRRHGKLLTTTAVVAAFIMVLEPYSSALAMRGGAARGGHPNTGAGHSMSANRNVGGNAAASRNANVSRNANRNANVNRNVSRNVDVNRNVNRNADVNRNVNRNVNANRTVGTGGWARPSGYWWRPGGAVAAGAAVGFVTAATAAAWAGPAPAPNMCWYYTDSGRTQGFWDACP